MALHILRELIISKCIASAGFFALMADECTDCSNREQFTINIRWVDANLQDNVAFIGLYAVDTISADCLVSAIKDVLIRMNLKLSCCRGQCYDGVSNMSGVKRGVAAQLCAEEKRALLLTVTVMPLTSLLEIPLSSLRFVKMPLTLPLRSPS